jgi:hypothetical protein
MSRRSAIYTPEMRERAVRLVAEVRPAYESDRAAIQAVAGILGIDNPDTLRKWVRREQSDSHSSNHGRSKMRALKRSVFRTHSIIIGSVVVVLGGLGLIYSQQLLGVGQPSSSVQAPHLEVDQVSFSYATGHNTDATPVQIDIKLLNTGTQIAAINNAMLVIQDSVKLPQCTSQGGFVSTGQYPAKLPASPAPGQVVSIPISQLIEANGADRFDLLLSTPLPRSFPDDESIYLYRIHLYLNYNIHASPLDIGEILISFPKSPDAGEYFWSKYLATHQNVLNYMVAPGTASTVEACDIRNSQALRSILFQPAMRTAELAAIPSQLAY